MNTITFEIFDAVRAALDTAARREHKSAEKVTSESLARVVQAQQQLDYLAERGNRKDFDEFLAKAPDVPPAPNDKV